TPARRNARMSLSAVIVSTGGSLVQSNSDAGSLAPPRVGGAPLARPPSSSVCVLSSGTPGAAAGFVASASSSADSRLRRDQRAMKFSGSLIAFLLHRSAPRQRLRVGAVALAFVEHPLDMMFSHEGVDGCAYRLRHRHDVDKVAARFGPGLALGRIGGHGEHLVRRLDAGLPQRHPEHGRAGTEIVAV